MFLRELELTLKLLPSNSTTVSFGVTSSSILRIFALGMSEDSRSHDTPLCSHKWLTTPEVSTNHDWSHFRSKL